MNKGIGEKFCLKSLPNLMSQTPSAAAKDPVTSSDSIDDLATSPCFLDAHEIGVLLKV